MSEPKSGPHKAWPWKDNWSAFSYLTPEVKHRFYDEWLRGGRSLKLVVGAGPQTFLDLCESACDWAAQFEAGFPVPLKLIGAFCEPIFTTEGAASVNAINRLHKFLQPMKNVESGIWDPNVKRVRQLREKVEDGYATLRRKHPALALPPISYLVPNTPAAEEYITELTRKRTQKGRRAFDIFLSGPNGSWIPYWIRRTVGEVSMQTERMTRSGGRKRELCSARVFTNNYLSYGFCWGLHPVGPEGDEFGYCAYRGKDAFAQIVGNKLTHARVALMGLGPVEMDDPRLLDITGPLTEIGLEYPVGRRRTKEEFFNQCLRATEWYASQVRKVMFGDGTPNYPHLGHAIAKRILVLDSARRTSEAA